ncbi:NAD(P)-dependent alcohol dehydrogenase [Methylobacterium sp. J-048]|uniref:zinc-dependent alcohol dehydrogenase family protein n=1 Tax=Methylobacterium sp. J-048 TaxID=2836635 RepID=UPI001FBB9957|nr:NAD(P)-dependent alcohol dehydrogenase [Methylobacterium sp. J-048]MCJ2055769.1 NAD(P)-dependent alcohol dehydrogenase [Methylobacterium sp. J-048]
MTTMRRWDMTGFGRWSLRLEQVPIPEPLPRQVLVKAAAASLNYRDKLVIEHGMGLVLGFPFTPASDLAGTVAAIGEGVTRVRPGDRVITTFFPDWIDGASAGSAKTVDAGTLGGAHQGILADYVALPEAWLVAAPRSLDFAEASTLPCAGLTAWFALVERGHLRAGQSVLVQGTGGVALFGLQIAKAHGAEVFVTSASGEKRERARALDADHAIDRDGWVGAVYQLTADRGIDHILELVGGAHLAQSLEAAAVDGRVSVIGVIEGYDLSAAAGQLLLKSATVQGIRVGHRRALEDLVRAVDVMKLKPVIDRHYALADVPAALDHLDGGPFGKIVITFD